MAVKDYKTNPDENTTISGINIAEGCAPSGINNAIRQLMADVKSDHDAQESTNTELAKVMTGATASDAGKSGQVPTPSAGKQDKPLNGAGQWADFIDCMVTSIKNSDGTAIDAAKLLDMLSKFLPISGGSLTGTLSVPSVFTIRAEGEEGGEIHLLPGTQSSQIGVIDQQRNCIRFWGYNTKDSRSRVNLGTGEFEGIFRGAVPNVFVGRFSDGFTIPPGGTWYVIGIPDHGGTANRVIQVSDSGGGTHFTWSFGGYSYAVFAIRYQ